MPQNKIIYAGVVLVVGTALVWLGAELTKRIEWLLPYTAVAGAILLVVGVAQEILRKHRAKQAQERKEGAS